MKRFQFSLKAVVTIRALHEQRAREAFAAASRAVVESEESLASVRARVAEIEAALRAGREQSFRPREHAEFLAAHREELLVENKATEAVAQTRAHLDATRAGWLESRRHLQVIENLQARARHRHRLEAERVEQAALDEHAALRALRLADPLS